MLVRESFSGEKASMLPGRVVNYGRGNLPRAVRLASYVGVEIFATF